LSDEAPDQPGADEVAPRAGGPAPARAPVIVHAALFLATFLTTTMSGAIHQHPSGDIAPIKDGLSYSLPLMLILLCHELGHYFVARWHGVDASLPFFIPFPPWFGLGTMGAVISMRRATTDRKKLIDVGAAGPLAGLCVAIPVLLYGLAHSHVGPLMPQGSLEGNSILYAFLKHASKGLWLPDGHQDVYLHPTAYAGWVGLLITMINLMPIGQLDGGHIARAALGQAHEKWSGRLHVALPILGVIAGGVMYWIARRAGRDVTDSVSYAQSGVLPWLVWTLMLGWMRRQAGEYHPPVGDTPLDPRRRRYAIAMLVIFLLIATPVPFRPAL
jgi:membrane-associated protease RseP (regulator of RpoE activity)